MDKQTFDFKHQPFNDLATRFVWHEIAHSGHLRNAPICLPGQSSGTNWRQLHFKRE